MVMLLHAPPETFWALQVETCRKVLAELIILEAQIKAQSEAFKRVSQGYEATPESSTDFLARVEEYTAEIHVE